MADQKDVKRLARADDETSFRQPAPGPDGRVTLFDLARANTKSQGTVKIVVEDGAIRAERKLKRG